MMREFEVADGESMQLYLAAGIQHSLKLQRLKTAKRCAS